jgi:hypothetical protein
MRAMKGDEKAAINVSGCGKFGLLPPVTERETCPGGAVLTIPWEWETEQFVGMYEKHSIHPGPATSTG